jgi:3-methyladenine DNA glycosylase AlkD
MKAADIRRRLMARADPASIPVLQSFFKTGAGEYGEGDVFVGVRVPAMREVCRDCRDAGLGEIRTLLKSRVHEERLVALLLLVDRFERGDEAVRRDVYEFYLAHTAFINNWDLVDSSAGPIVGAWLFERSRRPLGRLAKSKSLWERRVAIVATHYFIRRGDLADTFQIADLLLEDSHDLIHKAVGWMLREAGNQDGSAERRFLITRYQRMPRTMLRYAIEKFPAAEREKYLKKGKGKREKGKGKRESQPQGPRSRSTRSRGESMNSSSPRKSPGANR